MKKIILAFGMVLATAFACFAANPASDFDYHLMSESDLKDLSQYVKGLNTKGDYISLWYNGNDSTVEIPEEIEGCKVICVTLTGDRKYVVPASVIWVYTDGDYYNPIPDIEFLRPKDKAFFWETSMLPRGEELEKLRDRKIVFIAPSYNGVVPAVRMTGESVTWSKNWSTFTTKWMKYNSNDFRVEGGVGELIIEEGFQELPFRVCDCCEKLVLPKSLKIIRKGTIEVDGTLKDIVIPAGAKIKIEPDAIEEGGMGGGVDNMSITTQRALKAQGYSW